jgi:transcriptional regulator with XRE-family HTH domain
MTQRQIAAEFGVSPSTVSDIASGRTWGWLE